MQLDELLRNVARFCVCASDLVTLRVIDGCAGHGRGLSAGDSGVKAGREREGSNVLEAGSCYRLRQYHWKRPKGGKGEVKAYRRQ